MIVLEYVDANTHLEVAFGNLAASALAEMLASIHDVDVDLPLQRNADYFRRLLGTEPRVMDVAMREPELRAALGEVALPDPSGFVHGDFWPGNVLWAGDRIAAVIDWESAALGDPLADVACTRLDLLFVYGHDAMDEFTECYRAVRPFDDEDLAVWHLVAALRPCGHLASWAASMREYGRTDITESALRARHAEFAAAALAASR
jgi:aminoglycoside phosphotransferase (APT) family kinase protein